MSNVIQFPEKKVSNKKIVRLTFCKKCLFKKIPDISNRQCGEIAMLIPVIDENKKPFHAYVTIIVADIKKAIINSWDEKFVNLAEFANVHFIGEGFEPKSDILANHFSDSNSKNLNVLH
jgi:hypothetical protein